MTVKLSVAKVEFFPVVYYGNVLISAGLALYIGGQLLHLSSRNLEKFEKRTFDEINRLCLSQDCRSNAEQFPQGFCRGSLQGIWWAFVTMATVG